jgi:hypothetical protein
MSSQPPARRNEADVAYTSGYQTGKAHEAGRSQLDRAASEATKIEQARAIAEVQAAAIAQERPRDVARAIAEMNDVCKRKALADRAFYRYKRSGQVVSDISIHLARELARIWGNIQYGIAELNRTTDQSEMLAAAWDLQTNTRVTNSFISPHARDTTDQKRKPLVDLRDVYENNANLGARRVRECILAVIPKWFSEEARDICAETRAKETDGKPRDLVIAAAVKAFADRNITRDQLEAKLGRAADKWTDMDLATLRLIKDSLDRGEITVEEEFPDERVTSAEILAPLAAEHTNGRPRQRVATRPRSDALDDTPGPSPEDIAAMNAEAAEADPGK